VKTNPFSIKALSLRLSQRVLVQDEKSGLTKSKRFKWKLRRN